MITLWEEGTCITKNWLAHCSITLFYLVLLHKTISEYSNCKSVIRNTSQLINPEVNVQCDIQETGITIRRHTEAIKWPSPHLHLTSGVLNIALDGWIHLTLGAKGLMCEQAWCLTQHRMGISALHSGSPIWKEKVPNLIWVAGQMVLTLLSIWWQVKNISSAPDRN
jgi:hypothetical protein